MKQTAGKRWGVYASVAVFMLLLVPILVGAAEPEGLVPCDGLDCNFASLVQLVDGLIDFLLFKISIPLVTILFLWAGFLLITAGGNPGRMEQAKSIFKNAGIGFIIALSAWLIVNLIVTTFVKSGYGGYGNAF
ncbi:MAG: pilin [Patescibacteria group bacterium]